MLTHASSHRGGFLAACVCVAAGSLARAQGPDGPLPPAAVRSPSGASPGSIGTWGYADGFVLRSADGEDELEIGGLLRAEARWNGAERKPQSEYDLTRLRLDLAGRFQDVFRFRLQPDFAQEDVELEEAWVGADLFGGSSRFMAGRMRVPFGLEEMRRQEFIDLPRLSIVHQLTPGPDTGLFLFGLTPGGRFEWNLAVVNGTEGPDTSGDKDLAARLVVHPFRDDTGRSPPVGGERFFEHLQLGGALTVGTQDHDISGDSIDNAVGLPLMSYAPGVRLNGQRLRMGLEGAWHRGPWFAQAELVRVSQELTLEEAALENDIDAGYIDLSYALTGEERGFDGVKPAQPVGRGGMGAWIAALRYSELHTDGQLAAQAFLLPDTWVGRVRSVELGLTWVLNEHALLRFAFVHSMYSNAVLVGGELVDDENAGILQFQLSF